MKENKSLISYIFGIGTILLIFPVLDKARELIELWLESLKVKPQKRILEGNKDTVVLREFLRQTYPVYDDEFEYIDELDEDE